MEPNVDRGTSFEVVSVIFTFFTIVAYSLRVYSRQFLTRSLGSDDFSMFFALLTSTGGQVGAIIQVEHGMGRHRQYISDQDYAITELWATIAWFFVFISFFFLRASIMLFVLRLLPSYKVWQHRVIYVAFVLNFLISLLGNVSYGIQCIPFTAIWQEQLQANAKCYSKDVLVIVNQVNGILSCIIDITTALIPQFLLWNVSMKPKTKRILNVIFALGVLTAATSIGRAASINRGAIENDTNWRLMPSRWWAMFEEKCGIIFACGPALRQLYGYYKRTGTLKPTKHRQPPEQDFVKMRGRITWRDVFWYQKKHAIPSSRDQGGSSYDGSSKTHESHKDKYPVAAAIQGVNRPPNKGNPDVEAAFGGDADRPTRERVVKDEARAHRFGQWQQKFRSMFNTTSGSTAHSDPSSFQRSTEMSTEPRHLEKTSQRSLLGERTDASNASYSNNHNTSSNVESRAESIDRSRVSESTNAQQRGSDPTELYGRRADRDRIGRRYREWGLLPHRGQANEQTPETGPSGGTGASETPSRDHELASTLTNPIARPAARLEK